MEQMTLQTILNDYVVEILKYLIIAAVLVLARYVIPWMRKQLKSIAGEELAAWIESAVWAAQQTITSNDEKKAYVRRKVIEWLHERKLSISSEDLDMLIEQAVLTMKAELGDTPTPSSPAAKKTSTTKKS